MSKLYKTLCVLGAGLLLATCGLPVNDVPGPPSYGLVDDAEPPAELSDGGPEIGSWVERVRPELRLPLRMEGHVAEVAFDAGGRYLFLSEHVGVLEPRGRVHVWDLETAEQLHVLLFEDLVLAVTDAGEGRLATAGLDGFVRIWDAASGQELRSFPGAEFMGCLAVDAEARWIAVSFDYEDKVVVLDLATGERRLELAADWECELLAFSADGSSLHGRFALGINLVWSTDAGELVRRFTDGHFSELTFDALSPAGRLLATNAEEEVVKVWDTLTGDVVRKLTIYESGGPYDTEMEFLLGGRVLATGDYEGDVKLWRLSTSDLLATLPCDEGEARPDLGVSRDGSKMACVVQDASAAVVWSIPPSSP